MSDVEWVTDPAALDTAAALHALLPGDELLLQWNPKNGQSSDVFGGVGGAAFREVCVVVGHESADTPAWWHAPPREQVLGRLKLKSALGESGFFFTRGDIKAWRPCGRR